MNPILATFAAAFSIVRSIAQGVFSGLFGSVPTPSQKQRKDFSLEVVRPDDLLVLTLDFYNVSFTAAAGGAPAQLARRGAGDAFMVVHFPPQSFAEEAFLEFDPPAPSSSVGPPPVISRLGGPSQVVVRLASAAMPLDLTLEILLRVLAQNEQVTQHSLQEPGPARALGQEAFFGGVRSLFTAIEAPYRLVLSPSASSRWEHALTAVKDATGTRTEMWHTRLTGSAYARAVWSPDVRDLESPPTGTEAPFRMSLSRLDRHKIVHSTANRALPGNDSVTLDRLLLSSQGAWLNLHGAWETSLGLAEWQHILTGGRDQFARVVKEGHLFHLGHKAVTIEITERKLKMVKQGELEGKPGAYLIKKLFVAVREPTKIFGHRHSPFRQVTIKTRITPALMPAAESELLPGKGLDAFWPRVKLADGSAPDFLFQVVATDWEGREIEFSTPLAFIAKSISTGHTAADAALMGQIVDNFQALPKNHARRQRPLGGKKIAFAPPAQPGDTSHETTAFTFGALKATGSPRFLPQMSAALVDVPAVRNLTGKTAPSTIEFDPDFLKFTGPAIGNMGEVYARLSGSTTPVKFPPEKTGGLVAPDFGISALSRGFGPVGGDAATFAAGNFKPADAFKGVKLLGCIDLAGIISDLINVTPAAAGKAVPGLKTIRTEVAGVPVFRTSYLWALPAEKLIDQLQLPTKGVFTPNQPNAQAFSIETLVDTPLQGGTPAFSVTGELRDFSLTLLPAPPIAALIKLHFERIRFRAGSDAKVDVSVIFKKFEFIGALEFVNKLQEFVPLDGFDDPPYLDLVLPPAARPGVNVGFTLGIPTIGIGIFTLQNIAFSAGFYLPLIGAAANLRLAFCERHQPFTLTVSAFGGGGFFAIDISLEKVTQIEAALEFGASIALNLGVAAGSATIMGGVYFQKSGEGFSLSAYLRAAGSLSVLGIITVSVEFYLSLNYQSGKAPPHGGKLWGEASLKVKVKIAFFSKSVSIKLEREFAGSDPTFAQLMAPDAAGQPGDWTNYCAAFADYPA